MKWLKYDSYRYKLTYPTFIVEVVCVCDSSKKWWVSYRDTKSEVSVGINLTQKSTIEELLKEALFALKERFSKEQLKFKEIITLNINKPTLCSTSYF